MSRFVLRYRGVGKRPQETVDRLQAGGTAILEDAGRTKVEASEQALHQVLDAESDWVVSSETHYPVPDARKRLSGSAR